MTTCKGSIPDYLERRYQLCQVLGYDAAADKEGVSKETIRRNCRAYKQILRESSVKSGMRVLLLDIENSPTLSYIWSLWTEPSNFQMVEKDWYIISWSVKWLDEDEVVVRALPDYATYATQPSDDTLLLADLWDYLNEADVIVAHNGKRFDMRKINARFVVAGLPPPSPSRMVDTLLEARSNFMFTSNKLDDLGQILGVGSKADTGGFALWRSCINGDMEAWEKMKAYNAQDVLLLEKVYYKLRPFMRYHPNFGAYDDNEVEICSKCGSTNLIQQGYAQTDCSRFPKYLCKDCGSWSRGRKSVLSPEKKKSLLTKIAS
jgi:hypothetical protein